MNTGRLSLILWVLFLLALFGAVSLVQVSVPAALACAAVSILSFVYAMWLGLVGMRKGDPWVRRHGASGTAEILEAKETSWAMASGEYYGIGAPSVWKYRLEVTVPGRSPYRTSLYICAHLGESGTIPVRVSRLNHKRVTVDPEAMDSDAGGRRATRRQALEDALAAKKAG